MKSYHALALFSGGLDSILAAKTIAAQGLQVLGLHFVAEGEVGVALRSVVAGRVVAVEHHPAAIHAERDGTVEEVLVAAGAQIDAKDLLIVLKS